VDNVTAKIDLATECARRNIPIISSMGAGNKLDPTRFEVADIKKTSVCPLAKVMRRELKKRGVEHLKVVYSKEQPLVPMRKNENGEMVRADCPGSIAFVPSCVGLIIAGEVVKDIAFARLERFK
jgi:tRNA A37 threonylcarbamoyladenosine dehydratase